MAESDPLPNQADVYLRTESPVSGLPDNAARSLSPGRAASAIAFGLVMIVLIAIAIRNTEMVSGQYISNGVPPLPAFAVLLLLSLLRPLLQRSVPRLAPNRAQMFLIYSMLTVAVILSGLYHVRAFLPHLVAMQYWAKEGSPMAAYARQLPDWYAPHDRQAIKDYYEGSAPGGHTPWRVWLLPLGCWSVFFIVLFLGIFSLVTLVRKQWLINEKLSFPLLTIPLALTSDDWSRYGSLKSRRALFLAGFGVAALFNGINILHILVPSIPAPGFDIPIGAAFTQRPWEVFRSTRILFMLETIGIGYFVPLDVSFSTWFFYFLTRFIAVGGSMAGYDRPGFPFLQEQSAGGAIAMGMLLLWGLRRAFAESWQRAFRSRPLAAEARAERWAWIGLFGSMLFLLAFCRAAGLSLWLGVPFFGVLGLFVLVYARMRAETGVPLTFIFPEGMAKEIVVNTFSVPQAVHFGGERAFIMLSTLGWLSRFQHPEEQAAYQMDGLKLAQEGRIPLRTLFIALLLAFSVGLWAAFWVHLSAYYAQGSNLTPSAGGIGEYREALARQEYTQMASQLASMPPRDFSRLTATAGGFCFVILLTLLRRQWLSCPFHPLGFLMATAYGDNTGNWFPLLVAWLCKALILRAGGLRAYRVGMPFFLGLAIGHLLVGGVLWPLFSLTLSHNAANAYHLVFGE